MFIPQNAVPELIPDDHIEPAGGSGDDEPPDYDGDNDQQVRRGGAGRRSKKKRPPAKEKNPPAPAPKPPAPAPHSAPAPAPKPPAPAPRSAPAPAPRSAPAPAPGGAGGGGADDEGAGGLSDVGSSYGAGADSDGGDTGVSEPKKDSARRNEIDSAKADKAKESARRYENDAANAKESAHSKTIDADTAITHTKEREEAINELHKPEYLFDYVRAESLAGTTALHSMICEYMTRVTALIPWHSLGAPCIKKCVLNSLGGWACLASSGSYHEMPDDKRKRKEAAANLFKLLAMFMMPHQSYPWTNLSVQYINLEDRLTYSLQNPFCKNIWELFHQLLMPICYSEAYMVCNHNPFSNPAKIGVSLKPAGV